MSTNNIQLNLSLNKQPLKKEKTKILMTNCSLMKVKSIAECSLGAFCNTFDLHKAIIGLETNFLVFFMSGRLRQVLLYALLRKALFLLSMLFKGYFYC